MNEQEQIYENFIDIIKKEDISQLVGDAFWDFVQELFAGEAFSGLSSIKNVKDIFFQIPDLLFWNKMQRFLLGTYKNFEEQVKMASKFDNDNKKYKEFVLQMFETVNKLDFEIKVDYYARLTRSHLLGLIDEDLFYALRRVIIDCTTHELKFIYNTKKGQRLNYDMAIFSLNGMGLVEQQKDNNSSFYLLTDLALKLKEHALNSDDQPGHYALYSNLKPPAESALIADDKITEIVDKAFEETKIFL